MRPQGLLQITSPDPSSGLSENPLTHDTCFIVWPKGLFLAARGPFEPEDISGAFLLQTLPKSQFTCCKDIHSCESLVAPLPILCPSPSHHAHLAPPRRLILMSSSPRRSLHAGCSLCWNVPSPDSPPAGSLTRSQLCPTGLFPVSLPPHATHSVTAPFAAERPFLSAMSVFQH